MGDCKTYADRLLAYFSDCNVKLDYTKNYDYLLISTLNTYCDKENLPLSLIFALLEDKKLEPQRNSYPHHLTIEVVMEAVESFRHDKDISKRELCRRLDMDRSNFQKLYSREGEGVNFHVILELMEALGVSPLDFYSRCRRLSHKEK